MSTDEKIQAERGQAGRREAERAPTAPLQRDQPEVRPPDPAAESEKSAASRPTRKDQSIFGRTPAIRGIPVPIIVGGVALLAALLILYLVFSRQSPLVGGDTGDTGQPVQPQIQQEAPE